VRASGKYAASAIGVVALVTLVLWPWLDSDARRGVVLAGLIALPVQITAFWLLLRYRDRVNGFLAVWAGGTLVRMAVVAVAATYVIRAGMDGAVTMLLALAGFFFGLLLLEPVFFRLEATETT
jgi:hypothetical protein